MNNILALQKYHIACDHIAGQFCNHMWYDFDDWSRVAPDHAPHIFDVWDDFWDIWDMYLVIRYNIDKDFAFKRYRARIEEDLKTNLYHYYMQWKNKQDWSSLYLEN